MAPARGAFPGLTMALTRRDFLKGAAALAVAGAATPAAAASEPTRSERRTFAVEGLACGRVNRRTVNVVPATGSL